MAVLDNLLRLHRYQLEERQRYLADLESLAERLHADARRLSREIEDEAKSTGVPLDPDAVHPLFLRPLIERQRKLAVSAAEVDAQIVEAREAVPAAQQEGKLYEVAWEQRAEITGGERLTRRSRRHQEALALSAGLRRRLG